MIIRRVRKPNKKDKKQLIPKVLLPQQVGWRNLVSVKPKKVNTKEMIRQMLA